MTSLEDAGFADWEVQILRESCPYKGPKNGIQNFEQLIEFWNTNGKRRAFLNSKMVSIRLIDKIERIIALSD